MPGLFCGLCGGLYEVSFYYGFVLLIFDPNSLFDCISPLSALVCPFDVSCHGQCIG